MTSSWRGSAVHRAGLAIVALCAILSATVAFGRPNVLFIAVDDLNSCLAGMEGELPIHTPHLDRLAARGTLFTNAHCAAPACNPSRVAVMTGQAPTTSGLYMNYQDWRDSSTLSDVVTLPQLFQNHGYTTRGGGKLYHAASINPKMFGGYIDPRPWNEYFPSKSQQLAEEPLPDAVPTNGNADFYRGFMDWAPLDIDVDEMGDAKVVAWAEQQLSQAHASPLFLAVGIYRPHIPWYNPREYFDRHPMTEIALPEIHPDDLDDVPSAGQNMARRHWHEWIEENGEWKKAVQGYLASVSFADDMIGRLIDALDSGPLADNTIIVLWSDHGYHLGQKEHWEKFALWEVTTRVPLIVVVPDAGPPGQQVSQPTSLLDIYPTLADLCDLPAVGHLDGESLVHFLQNPNRATGRVVTTTQGRGNHGLRSDRWRYIRYADESEELYDQLNDPKNFHNLANDPKFTEVKLSLRQHLPAIEADPEPTRESPLRKRD